MFHVGGVAQGILRSILMQVDRVRFKTISVDFTDK